MAELDKMMKEREEYRMELEKVRERRENYEKIVNAEPSIQGTVFDCHLDTLLASLL